MELIVTRVDALAPEALEPLAAVSRAEGHRLVQRLCDEWLSGANRFDRGGEALFLARRNARVVAVCGINVDPYSDDPRLARLRHLYVHPDLRRHGVGRSLVERCLAHAAGNFDRMRLRTTRPDASRFYLAVGFRLSDEADATHSIELARITAAPR